ncbi:extracellular solute-binding protein [Microbacterium sp. A204]|uniref:extracellular solute-binding protein n=1 Tax=Microbacterium sp. A204 TaxID=3457321 RepID=UPI003FD5C561
MHITAPHRRRVLAGIAAASAVALLAGCAGGGSPSESGGSDQISGQIIWADYGGPTNESRQVAYFEGFFDETDVEVVSVSIEDAVYYGMLEGEDGDYDVLQVDMRDVVNYADSVQEIPKAAQGDLIAEEFRPYILGGFYVGLAQGWLTETFDDGGPTNWADLFDTEKYPGKRAWPGAPGSFDASFEIALLADGVAPEDLYPLDLDRATKKLDSIRDDMVFYQSYPEVQQLLSSGSAAIAVSVTGQFTALQNAGLDVTVQWNEAFGTLNGFVIPEKAGNPDAVAALGEWLNVPENQAVFTERTLYGPVNPAVFDLLSDDVKTHVVNAPEHDNMLEWDDNWRGKNSQLLMDTYGEWLAG